MTPQHTPPRGVPIETIDLTLHLDLGNQEKDRLPWQWRQQISPSRSWNCWPSNPHWYYCTVLQVLLYYATLGNCTRLVTAYRTVKGGYDMNKGQKNRNVELQNLVRALKTPPNKKQIRVFNKMLAILEEEYPSKKWTWVMTCPTCHGGGKAWWSTVAFYDKNDKAYAKKAFENLI